MGRRYLFGPVTEESAEQNLHSARTGGDCLTFAAAGAADVSLTPNDAWDAVRARLPVGWQPEFVVLYLPYTNIPPCLWSAPVPLVGLAPDWNLLWHYYRRILRRCDLVLTDTTGVEVLAQEGIPQSRAANLFGLERVYVETAWPEGPRDIGHGSKSPVFG